MRSVYSFIVLLGLMFFSQMGLAKDDNIFMESNIIYGYEDGTHTLAFLDPLAISEQDANILQHAQEELKHFKRLREEVSNYSDVILKISKPMWKDKSININMLHNYQMYSDENLTYLGMSKNSAYKVNKVCYFATAFMVIYDENDNTLLKGSLIGTPINSMIYNASNGTKGLNRNLFLVIHNLNDAKIRNKLNVNDLVKVGRSLQDDKYMQVFCVNNANVLPVSSFVATSDKKDVQGLYYIMPEELEEFSDVESFWDYIESLTK